jgi:hypothetical protein
VKETNLFNLTKVPRKYWPRKYFEKKLPYVAALVCMASSFLRETFGNQSMYKQNNLNSIADDIYIITSTAVDNPNFFIFFMRLSM